MKNTKKIVAVAIAVGTCSILTSQADTLADWTFETSAPAGTGKTSGPYSPETGSGSATGSHASATTVYSNPTGNGSAKCYSANNWAIGDYYQFSVSTLGYNDIIVSFDQTGSATGPKTFQFSYSTDGATFTSFGSTYNVLVNASPNTPWSGSTYNAAYTFSENLTSIPDVNGLATVYFRITDTTTTSLNGGTVATAGTDRVDNFLVTGDVVATPEPTTLALAGVGGLACLVAFRRRL